ncbi:MULTISPECIES: antiterminator Q family protein [Serratia]|uniref:antiterminator Q family protein n=1 Tax=Serratia TaxID=613 RepID=UPI00131ED901
MAETHLSQIFSALATNQSQIHRQAEPGRHCVCCTTNRPVLRQFQAFALHHDFCGAGTRKSKPSCCDNDGLIIDGAVGRLKKVRDERELGVIMLHYCYGVSKSAIARRWKISEGSVRQKLMMAESFIEGCQAMTGATLEMDSWTHQSEI